MLESQKKKKNPKLSFGFILQQSFAKPHLHATQFEKERLKIL